MYIILLYPLALPSKNIDSKVILKWKEGEDREKSLANNNLSPKETHFGSINLLARTHFCGPPLVY